MPARRAITGCANLEVSDNHSTLDQRRLLTCPRLCDVTRRLQIECCVDYCNVVLAGAPKLIMDMLQRLLSGQRALSVAWGSTTAV